ERLRLTYEDLRRVNPRLVYARGHGQGQRGPDARRGGYDGVSFWARGGIADRLSGSGQPHVAQRPAFGDFIGGACIAGGVAAALFRRERTGEGSEVDVSLLGTALWVLSPDITAALMYGFMLPASGDMPRAPNPLAGAGCRDGDRGGAPGARLLVGRDREPEGRRRHLLAVPPHRRRDRTLTGQRPARRRRRTQRARGSGRNPSRA